MDERTFRDGARYSFKGVEPDGDEDEVITVEYNPCHYDDDQPHTAPLTTD